MIAKTRMGTRCISSSNFLAHFGARVATLDLGHGFARVEQELQVFAGRV
jgi:hypothetical protein